MTEPEQPAPKPPIDLREVARRGGLSRSHAKVSAARTNLARANQVKALARKLDPQQLAA